MAFSRISLAAALNRRRASFASVGGGACDARMTHQLCSILYLQSSFKEKGGAKYSFMHLFFHSLRHSCKTTPPTHTHTPRPASPKPGVSGGSHRNPPYGALTVPRACVCVVRKDGPVGVQKRGGTHSSELTGGFFLELADTNCPRQGPRAIPPMVLPLSQEGLRSLTGL